MTNTTIRIVSSDQERLNEVEAIIPNLARMLSGAYFRLVNLEYRLFGHRKETVVVAQRMQDALDRIDCLERRVNQLSEENLFMREQFWTKVTPVSVDLEVNNVVALRG